MNWPDDYPSRNKASRDPNCTLTQHVGYPRANVSRRRPFRILQARPAMFNTDGRATINDNVNHGNKKVGLRQAIDTQAARHHLHLFCEPL